MKPIPFFILTFLIFNLDHSQASDHVDGPITTKHRVTDISDLFAFPNPNKKGNLSIVLNFYPFTVIGDHPSELVDYEFEIRKAKISESRSSVETFSPIKIMCKFTEPSDHKFHLKCSSESGASGQTDVGSNQSKGAINVYCGLAADPFFTDKNWTDKRINEGETPVADPIKPSNIISGLNTFSIVLDFELKSLFGKYDNELITVTARALDAKDHNKQLDWIGRPEITNFTLGMKTSPDHRDSYNTQITPYTSSNQLTKYKERILKRIKDHYDKQDEAIDWNNEELDKFSDLLVRDFLIIAPDKKCDEDSYLDIEMSLLHGKEIETCGGRKLNDDIVDRILSYYITSKKDRLSDGVDNPQKKPQNSFPYVSPPNSGFAAWAKAMIARSGIGI